MSQIEKLNYTCLINPWVKEKIRMRIIKLWELDKTKILALKSCRLQLSHAQKKFKILKIDDLRFHLKCLEKDRKANLKKLKE